MQPLPIDPLLPQIVAAARDARGRAARRLVLEAPPGAGKTTRVPPALLDAGVAGERDVVVLQPRRLAARMAARRVAEERGERLGDSIGFQIRFDRVGGHATRLWYVTEGVLSRRMLSDPSLDGVGCVVLDEFHERHLATDVALAMLRRLQEGQRKDLAIVVMSATLDAEPVAAYLGGCPRIRSEGRAFPVEIEHAESSVRRAGARERRLEDDVAAAVARVVAEAPAGDVLVFLPGAAEIRRAMDACRPLADRLGLLVLPLHGDLSADEQDRAVRPAAAGSSRKVILSTNVAETSVTIDGVVAVIDSGLARVASHAPWSGLPVLLTQPISRASAAQRAGRAGRTRAGRCLRLYTKADHDARPAFDLPEVRRLDLAETVLELRVAGIDPRSFPWFAAPTPSALSAADDLLRRLCGQFGSDPIPPLSPTLRRMARFPLHPRLARLLVEAEDRGVAEDGVAIAALLSERDLLRSARTGFGGGRRGAHADTGRSDVVVRLDALEEAQARRFDAGALAPLGIDAAAARAADRTREQLHRLIGRSEEPERTGSDPDCSLCVLAAFPDRVARRRRPGDRELLLCGGGSATLGDESVVRDADLLVLVDVEDRARGGPLVRIASAISAEQLVEARPQDVREETVARWDAAAERAEVVRRTRYDTLVLEEAAVLAQGSPEAERLLLAEAEKAGPRAFADPDAVRRLLARTEFAHRQAPSAGKDGVRALTDADVLDALRDLCRGKTSFREIRAASGAEGLHSLLDALANRLPRAAWVHVERTAPESIAMPGGWRARVEYEAGKPPYVEAQMQDFFGMREGPRVAGGAVPLTLHLLGPNRRPVQVTSDLAGFWSRQYAEVRREMARRYPKHAWPQDPLSASPPARGARRRDHRG